MRKLTVAVKVQLCTMVFCLLASTALAAGAEPASFIGHWAMDMAATMKEMPTPMKEELEKDAGFKKDANSVIVVAAGSTPDTYTVTIKPNGEPGSAGKRWAGTHALRLVPGQKPAEYSMLFGETNGGSLRVVAPGKRVVLERAGWQQAIVLQKVGEQ